MAKAQQGGSDSDSGSPASAEKNRGRRQWRPPERGRQGKGRSPSAISGNAVQERRGEGDPLPSTRQSSGMGLGERRGERRQRGRGYKGPLGGTQEAAWAGEGVDCPREAVFPQLRRGGGGARPLSEMPRSESVPVKGRSAFRWHLEEPLRIDMF